MKINKKIIVPFLSTVVGLSVAGGLGGAFAWYQFNSQVRTGFIGQSVAEGGMLQIGYLDNNVMQWGTERYLPDTSLIPVTFGALDNQGKLQRAKPYGYPEAGQQISSDYTKGWTVIENGQGYYQYDIYLRTLVADSNAAGDPANNIPVGYKLSAQDVYLSKMTLEQAGGTDDKIIADALRVHYQVEDGGNALISKNAHTGTKTLNLYGELDLDGDGNADTKAVDPWETGYGDTVIYGIDGETQTTKGIADVVESRDSDGNYPAVATAKKVCTTKTTTPMTKITITVWLEGWELLKVDDTTNYSDIWNPKKNAGIDVHVGMTFDVGRNILG